MARVLTAPDLAAEIDNVFSGAKSEIILVVPAESLTPIIVSKIGQAANRNIKATLVVGGKGWKWEREPALDSLKNVRIRVVEDLHGKCFTNHELTVIASLKLLKPERRSQGEMGILLEKSLDGRAFEEADQEIRSILEQSREYGNREDANVEKEVTATAFCVCCHAPLDYNTRRPLCRGCFEEYARNKSPKYPGMYCHRCGVIDATSYGRPLCIECYEETRKKTLVPA